MGKEILVAEKDEDLTYLIKFLLANEGIDVISVKSIQEAISLIPTLSIDAILAEIPSPAIGNIQEVEYLDALATEKHIPILYITKCVQKDIDVSPESYAVKLRNAVPMPFEIEQLVDKVKGAINLHEKQKNT